MERGNYPGASAYVRVEVLDAVEGGSIIPNLIPNGFESVYEPIAGFGAYTLPIASYRVSNTGSSVYSGIDYSNSDMNYLKPVPAKQGQVTMRG